MPPLPFARSDPDVPPPARDLVIPILLQDSNQGDDIHEVDLRNLLQT